MKSATPLMDLMQDEGSPLSLCEHEMVVHLADMIERIERAIGSALQRHAAQSQLTLLEAQALAVILKKGVNARLSTIAEATRMPLSTMTGVASRLEAAGLVERKRATDDGRAFVLTLTDTGIAKTKEMFQPFFREVTTLIDKSGPDTLPRIVDSFAIVCELAEQLGGIHPNPKSTS